MSDKKLTTIDNVVSGVLLEIGDEKDRQYYTRAYQWVLDEFRRLTVHYSPFFHEKKVLLETDRYSAPYPDDLLKLLSVGIYVRGEFQPFIKKPNLSIYPVDATDNIFEDGDREGEMVPKKGFGFASQGTSIGYWREDKENSLIYVSNYRWDKINATHTSNTEDLTGKVVVRYKSSGLNCNGDTCIPYEFRELLIALVYYRFMKKNIPVEITNYRIQLHRDEIDVKQEEFNEITMGIDNLWEVKDAVYASMNVTAQR